MKSVIATLCALAMLAGVAFAVDKEKTCCEKAKDKGKDCSHKCCIDAKKDGKTCEKCNPPAKKDK